MAHPESGLGGIVQQALGLFGKRFIEKGVQSGGRSHGAGVVVSVETGSPETAGSREGLSDLLVM